MYPKKDAEAPPAVILSGRKTKMVEEHTDVVYGLVSLDRKKNLPNMKLIATLDAGYNKKKKKDQSATQDILAGNFP